MVYQFQQFHFDPAQHNLYKQGELVSLSSKAAEILALFLADPKKIYSKTEILDIVWAERVVSDQVVFQNISELRALFGDEAVKTFPRRGYQWQIDVRVDQHSMIDKQGANGSQPVDPEEESFVRGLFRKPSFYFIIILTLLCAWFIRDKYYDDTAIEAIAQHHQSPDLIILPFSIEPYSETFDGVEEKLFSKVRDRFERDEDIRAYVDTGMDPQVFALDYQRKTRELLDRIGAQYVLRARVRTYDQQVFINFNLIGRGHQWDGEYGGKDEKAIINLMVKDISEILSMETTDSMANPKLAEAKLKLMYERYPHNLPILRKLRMLLSSMWHKDEANMLSNKLLELTKDDPLLRYYKAEAFLGLGFDTGMLGNFDLSKGYLEEAAHSFKEVNNLEGLNFSHIQTAFYFMQQGKLEESKSYFKEAIRLSRENNRPTLELRSLLDISRVYHKTGDIDERDEYLYQAELLLDRHQFPKIQYAFTYTQLAIFSEDRKRKEQYLRRATSIYTSQEYLIENELMVYQWSAGTLVEMLIEDERWDEALALFDLDNLQYPIQKLWVSRVYFKKGDHDKAKPLAHETIEEVTLQGTMVGYESLSAALILFQIYEEEGVEEEMVRFKKYIQRTEHNHWREWNKDILREKGIL